MRSREEEIKTIHKQEKFFLICFMSLILFLTLLTVTFSYEHDIKGLEEDLTRNNYWSYKCWDQVQEKNEIIKTYREQTLHCTQGEINPYVTLEE